MDYSNPFGAIDPQSFGGTNSFGYTNPLSTMAADQKMRMALPLIQMMQQREQAETQDALTKSNEFQSPEQVSARRNEAIFKGNKAASDARLLPSQEALSQGTTDNSIALLPQQKQLQMKELTNKLAEADAKPHLDFINFKASIADQIKAAPKAMQPIMYQQAIEQYKQSHPDYQLPSGTEVWNQNTPRNLDMSKTISTNTAAHMQAMELERAKTDSAKEVAGITSGGTVRAAEIRAAAVRDVASEKQPTSSAAIMVGLKKKLADPNTSPEEREQVRTVLKSTASTEFGKMINQDPEVKGLANMAAIPGPQGQIAKRKYDQIVAKKHIGFMVDNNIADSATVNGVEYWTDGNVYQNKKTGAVMVPQ